MVLGPPGCGKTTRLLGLLEEELRSGVRAERIGCVTFTRAARRQVQEQVIERLGLRPTSFPWLRTLHSAAFRLLRLRHHQIMANDRWSEFAERFGYQLSDVPGEGDLDAGPREPPRQTADDVARAAYAWGRSRSLDVEQTLARCPADRLSSSGLQSFWRRLDAFKAEHSLLDFPDLLEAVLDRRLRPEIDVLFVDEAQDLSPQQIAVVESWMPRCARVYVAGDEDQAVYGFQGADPSWLLGLTRRGEVEVLRQSHRVPASVHALAARIIQQNCERSPKEYQPRQEAGHVRFLDEHAALAAVTGERSTFILARNRIYLGRWSRELMQRAVPFLVEGRGGVSPLSKGRQRTAVELVLRLGRGLGDDDRVTAAEMEALLSYVPSASGLVPRGTKTRVREARRQQHAYTRADLTAGLGLADLLRALERSERLELLVGMAAPDRVYFEALVQRFGTLPEPRVTLTSIHGSKGREADLVVVLPDLTRLTARGMLSDDAGREAEHRVFYVAVTRAREELIVVAPRGRRQYRFPSLRPAAGPGEGTS